jgi:hypothetical protein
MKKKISILALSTILSMSYISAQDVTGHWTGKVLDQYNIAYDFQVHGDTLTGKDTHPDGSVSDISNGKIQADSLSYDVPIQGTMTHVTGKLQDDIITLKYSIQGYDITTDLRRGELKQ